MSKEYNVELEKEQKLFETFRKTKEFKDYSEGAEEELYPLGKTRVIKYTTVLTDTEKTDADKILTNLFVGGNTSGNETFIENIKNGKFNLKFN